MRLSVNRRNFLRSSTGAAALLGSTVDAVFSRREARAASAAGVPTDLRFRQIHLDFHTSPQVRNIAEDFDAPSFAATLKNAHVDSVTVFARCHHGHIYFDSKKNKERIHPFLLRKNLLKEQIEACHKQGIRAPIYVTIQWDQFTADQHPEWRQVTAKGELQGTAPYEPGFYRFLCLNSPYAEFLKTHIGEIMSTLPVDGFFLDIVKSQDCSCANCRRAMQKRGIDPANETARQAFGAEVTDRWKKEMTGFIRARSQTATIFYNGGHVGPHLRATKATYSHFELESLPSGGWGYLHFPLTIRYARNLGKDCLGMTGKFHTSWGDFHSLKNQAALDFECFNMLALGAKCSVGDQLHPRGRLDAATYDLIGAVYAAVEKKEPWCKGARAVVEIAVVSPEESLGAAGAKGLIASSRGVVRMLQEGAHQFDIVDSQSPLDGYKLVVVPEDVIIKGDLKAHLQAFVAGGGALIATGKSAASDREFATGILGVEVKGDAPFSPDFIRTRGDDLGKGLPKTELVIYEKAQELRALAGTETLADVIVPYFNRTGAHYFSHLHTPSAGTVGYPGATKKGRTITFAHPLFTQYATRAPLWCKRLFLNAVALLLPDPLLRVHGPSTLLATLNEQAKEKRRVLHLLHYIPERRGDQFDVIEDVLPVHNVGLSVRTGGQTIRSVRLVPEGKEIPFTTKSGRIEFSVDKLVGHQMVELST